MVGRVATSCSVTIMTYEYCDLTVKYSNCFIALSFLKFCNFNNPSKVILVTCKQFCLSKRLPVCYKIDFQDQNTSHVVASNVPVARRRTL